MRSTRCHSSTCARLSRARPCRRQTELINTQPQAIHPSTTWNRNFYTGSRLKIAPISYMVFYPLCIYIYLTINYRFFSFIFRVFIDLSPLSIGNDPMSIHLPWNSIRSLWSARIELIEFPVIQYWLLVIIAIYYSWNRNIKSHDRSDGSSWSLRPPSTIFSERFQRVYSVRHILSCKA